SHSDLLAKNNEAVIAERLSQVEEKQSAQAQTLEENLKAQMQNDIDAASSSLQQKVKTN
ncbi:unnamed protein product, partial [Amoebophrya sp. A25]